MNKEKRCSRCLRTKDANEFHKHARSKDGLHSHCQACAKEVSRAWYEANLERRAASAKAWRAANPDKVKDISRAWHQENSDRKKAANRVWYEANREKKKATDRAWRAANPEKAKAIKARRDDRLAELPGGAFDASREDYKAVKRAQNGWCKYCGERDATDIDHVIPIGQKDASNDPSNIVWACSDCNRSKHNRTVDEWTRYLRIARPDHPLVRKP